MSHQSINHGSSKLAWYAGKNYQKGGIGYKYVILDLGEPFRLAKYYR